ncbi:hypothetical protein [Marinomonas atlantica]|uniref:hypothetical protein n=1 Tax=Marinomonas atlantica TaxID=1806668 RepID=UPI00082C09E7|nr:hypothetical protein [Marinomonas atlantica]
MSLKHRKQKGWVLLEVLIVSACVAFVLSAAQRQQAQLDQQLHTLLNENKDSSKKRFQNQAKALFKLNIPIAENSFNRPLCQRCRAGELRALLSYELNQW